MGGKRLTILLILILLLNLILIDAQASSNDYEMVGAEPGEQGSQSSPSWAGSDMDIKNVSIKMNNSYVTFRIGLEAPFQGGKGSFRSWWQIFLDTNKDTATRGAPVVEFRDFLWDYVVHIVNFTETNTLVCQIVKNEEPDDTLIGYCDAFTANKGDYYLYITVNRTLPDGALIRDSFYLMARTAVLNTGETTPTVYDLAPSDDYIGYGSVQTADYYMYNYDKNIPGWNLVIGDEVNSSISGNLDITWLNETSDSLNLYIGLSVREPYEWYQSYIYDYNYTVYIDVDNDTATGYQLKDDSNQVILGAEYKIVYKPGYTPRLYNYTLVDPDNKVWDFTFTRYIDYLKNPADPSDDLILIIPRYAINAGSGDPVVAAETTRAQVYPSQQGASRVDVTSNPLSAPIPESSYPAIAVLIVALSIIIYKYFL
ncbi:MAG: hypothetical protein F7C38_05950 [Desulfurococcales archaeon]|nr:hypothetical protein [Desulfurococcales archaeon]